VFIGRDGSRGEQEADALHFVTRTPARAGLGQPAAGLVLVSYAAAEVEDAGLALLREARPLPHRLQARVELREGDVVADDLMQFSLRYLGGETDGWTDRWDSTSIATLDELPTGLEIVIQLYEWGADGERVEGREHRRLVALPILALDLDEERSAAEPAAGSDECTTNDECLELFGDLVAEQPPQRRQQILNLATRVVGECYDPETAFAEALRQLGVDPDEACG
jgi:hypothetical protein